MEIQKRSQKTFRVYLTIMEEEGQLRPLINATRETFEIKKCTKCKSDDVAIDGTLVTCNKCGNKHENPKFYEETAEFIRWGLRLEDSIRKDSIVRQVNNGVTSAFIDMYKMKTLKLKRLLVDWSLNVYDEDKINLTKIERQEIVLDDGFKCSELTSECFSKITDIPEISDIITAFLAKADDVLELGQTEESKKN